MLPEELNQIADEQVAKSHRCKHRVCVCIAAGCVSTGADGVLAKMKEGVKERGLEDQVEVKGVGCMGLCSAGPLVAVDGEELMYQGVKPVDAPEIIESLESKPVERLRCETDTPFFKSQTKIVLENSGKIDPHSVEDYIAHGGYQALLHALTMMSPGEVIEQVVRSGLRGRGGGGYPTGLKWSTVEKAVGERKYVVCNADEGDPGAFMDRSVLESDPHRVLEGMALAAYAVGADHGYIYIRAEYPLAIAHLRSAIRQAQKYGLIGTGICGTRFNFNVELRLGAGAFVCGEETALIASIEGKRGSPRPRPPYPAEAGLWGKSTLINNVETFANIAPIINRGGEWFSSIGTERSKGTKVFALAGKIRNTGLIEVPMGITLREIIFDIGGGIPDGGKFKAVQTGGPSGGCIPEQFLDMQVDYDSLGEIGSIMGSGGMIITDETSSMVEVARYFMEFCMSESCGKCVPCRVGTTQLHGLLTKIINGGATRDDIRLIEDLCDTVRETSLCGLGMTAPNPVLSTLKYFRHEYEDLLVSTNGNGNGSAEKAESEATK